MVPSITASRVVASGPLKASTVSWSPDLLMSGVTLPVKVDVLGGMVGVLSMVRGM